MVKKLLLVSLRGRSKMNKLFLVTVVVCAVLISSYSEANASLSNQKVGQVILDSVKLVKEFQHAAACDLLSTLPEDLHENSRQLGLNSLFLKGQCYAGLGLNSQAKSYFEQLLELDPKAPRPYLDLALVYQYLGEIDKATSTYEKLLEIEGLSDQVSVNVEKLFSQRPDAIKWKIAGSLGGIIASNINNAPIAESIKIYGIEFIFKY